MMRPGPLVISNDGSDHSERVLGASGRPARLQHSEAVSCSLVGAPRKML